MKHESRQLLLWDPCSKQETSYAGLTALRRRQPKEASGCSGFLSFGFRATVRALLGTPCPSARMPTKRAMGLRAFRVQRNISVACGSELTTSPAKGANYFKLARSSTGGHPMGGPEGMPASMITKQSKPQLRPLWPKIGA